MAEFKGFRISSPYGSRIHPIRGSKDFHGGIDLVKQHNAPIKAFTTGTVLYAGMGQSGTGLGGYGNVVLLKDTNNRGQLYAHLDRVTVSKGQKVRANQIIGYQGQTGEVTGSHLHYEVRKHAEAAPPYGYRSNKQTSTLNPVEYLNQFTEKSDLIKEGMRGSEVKTLQLNLIKLGYSLSKYGADGVFGAETERAVRNFQSDQKITVDGIVGPVTKNRINQALKAWSKYPGTLIRLGSKGDNVKKIQQKVGTKVDGIFGKKTEQAVKNFQKKNGLAVDGIVGPKTWNKLF